MAKNRKLSQQDEEDVYNAMATSRINTNKFKKLKLNEISFTESQKKFKELIYNNTITICTGSAGTSKTFTACATALDLLNKQIVERVIFTKPIEESGTRLGMLPGTLDEKVAPYLSSYYETFRKLVPYSDFEYIQQSPFIEFKATAYMRGATFDNTLMIADECQNFDTRELILFITRLGKNSKIILLGDISQHDIEADYMGLSHVIKMLDGLNSVSHHKFTNKEIVRNPLLVEIVERYEQFKKENLLGRMKR